MKACIIIPTYNRAAMLRDAVNAAQRQTVRCDVVVVDDGSTDGTQETIRDLIPTITYHRHENRERGASRNVGIDLARSADVIFFLDADDVLEENHVARLLDACVEHPNASFVCSRALHVDASLKVLGRVPLTRPGSITVRQFLEGTHAVAPTMIAVQREHLGEIRFHEGRDLAGSEDWLFVGRLLQKAPAVRITPATAWMRIHDGNSSKLADSMERSMLLAHEKFFAKAPELADLEPVSRSELLVRAGILHYAAGNMKGSRRALREAIRTRRERLLDPRVPWTLLRGLLGARASSALRRLKRSILSRCF